VAPPTAVGVEGGFPDPVAPAEDEALGDRRGLAVGARVAWADGRVVATGSGVGLGVALGVGAGVAVTVTCPAGRSATFPTDAAENDTLLVPAGRRRDLRHVPLEVVPLARLRATVNVPTCATTLVAGLPA